MAFDKWQGWEYFSAIQCSEQEILAAKIDKNWKEERKSCLLMVKKQWQVR